MDDGFIRGRRYARWGRAELQADVLLQSRDILTACRLGPTSFLKSRPVGLPLISAARGTAGDGCTVVGVRGAAFSAGALDLYIGVLGGECGGYAAGTLYEIRDKRV